MKSGLKIGVLAVQGAFIEHKRMLESLGCECVELRQKSDICDLDGLVLPGGESTVQGKLLRELDMFDALGKDCKRSSGACNLRRSYPFSFTYQQR